MTKSREIKIYEGKKRKFEQKIFAISTNLTALTLTIAEAWLSLGREVDAFEVESIAIAIRIVKNII